jgi:prepilin-type N-terminal cleavage/methylation domain-containing protein
MQLFGDCIVSSVFDNDEMSHNGMKITNKFKKLHQSGFTLVEIMVVVAIIGLLMSVATVGIGHAIKTAKAQTCAMNVEAIESAKSLWGLENKKGDNDVPSEDDLKPLLKNGTFPACPAGGTYTINAMATRATCSIHPATGTPGTVTTTQ